MKKLLLLVAITLLVVSGCAKADPVYKVGTGSYTTVAPRAAGDATGRIQVNVTFATVVMDADGKFVQVFIDVAQNEGTFDVEGTILKAEAAATKKEKGDAYNMKPRSPIGKEWYEQIAVLEQWMVGKTLAEVLAMPLEANKPTGDDLVSSVTITVDGYLNAVEAAAKNAVELKGVAKVGSGSVTSVAPRAVTADVMGRIQVNTTFAGLALDKDGKVLHVFIDVAQNEGTFDLDGAIVKAEAAPTKREKGDAYNMKPRSPIGKEWYEQIEALEAWMLGKTVAEVLAMPLADRKPTGDDLVSSVTITVDGYLGAVEAASKDTRDLK